MAEILSKIPTPVIIIVIIALIIGALIAIINKAVKLGITLLIIVTLATLAMPYINKVRESQFMTELSSGIEKVEDNMSSLFSSDETID